MRIALRLLAAVLIALVVCQDADAASCTITRYNANDIQNAQRSCKQIVISGIQVAAGETLDLTHLQAGTKVIFQGTITWAYKEWEGPLIRIAGANIQIVGAPGHVLDGRGSLWWDGKGGNGGKKKPKFIRVKLTNSQISSLNIKNSPRNAFSINGCNKLVVKGVTIDNSAGDARGGHNTDGFDVGNSNQVTIQGCVVKNQDDCLAINSGTNIVFSGNQCSGGHGISIGSVGGRRNNVVKGVTVSGCVVTNSDNGIRIKTVAGATGSVSGVIFQNIKLSKIHKYGIVIESDYRNGGPTGFPTGGVPITGLVVNNVKGTVDPRGVNIYILVQNASNWKFSGVSIIGGRKKKRCRGIPNGAGVAC